MTMNESIEAARDRIGEAYHDARDRSSEIARQASDSIQDHPMIALAGGLALGALVAALLPHGKHETRALGALGSRLADTARSAADTGYAKLDGLGLAGRARDMAARLLACADRG